MTKKIGRSSSCGKPQAKTRLLQARKFLELASIAESDAIGKMESESASVAVSNAVLAGIAASDAACCFRLGMRPRADDHHQAESFLSQMEGGRKAAAYLSELISLKDSAQYGVSNVSNSDMKIAMRRASALLEFAQSIYDSN